MLDHRGIHKNCKISNIILDNSHMEKLMFDVTDDTGLTNTIRIRNYNAIEKLIDLKAEKCKTAYFDFGMTDVDIKKSLNGFYSIMNSPVDGIYDYYDIPSDEFEKLLA